MPTQHMVQWRRKHVSSPRVLEESEQIFLGWKRLLGDRAEVCLR